ncbi:hypothetical protein M422DRAFT_259302 [Sphaerobolus stellatus SS14]|uniref:Uncharacterized protein n=1 Tax=Sphaerobolus stellatus (strain SS14) TaxID=990650 RepID=A0A0C9U582_SPHS4|nr:hypothetical protein M422DRAFT_259302 [Sphaerobolus stellatus SS14]
MTNIDENQEVIACIQMSVNSADAKAAMLQENLDHTEGGPLPLIVKSEDHWGVRSPLQRTNPQDFEDQIDQDMAFCRFEARLAKFLSEVIDSEERPLAPLTVSRTLYQ